MKYESGRDIEVNKFNEKEVQIKLPVEKKYSQDWHIYNLAKTNEKRLFIELLRDLSKIIQEPKYQFGRPSIPLRDLFFCAGLKLYTGYLVGKP